MSDDRVPVRLVATADERAADEAVLDLAALGVAGHAFGCVCCQPRSALGQALGRLFTARARGTVPFFRAVAVVAPPGAAVAELIAADPVAAARFCFVAA